MLNLTFSSRQASIFFFFHNLFDSREAKSTAENLVFIIHLILERIIIFSLISEIVCSADTPNAAPLISSVIKEDKLISSRDVLRALLKDVLNKMYTVDSSNG